VIVALFTTFLFVVAVYLPIVMLQAKLTGGG
jgi:hypothetical protein